MKNIIMFLRRERLYVFILAFVIVVNILMVLPEHGSLKAKKKPSAGSIVNPAEEKSKKFEETFFAKRTEMEEMMRKNQPLAVLFSLASLLIITTILLGILVDFLLLSARFSRKPFDIRTRAIGPTSWTLLDVGKVVLLFLFFGYIIIIIESFLADFIPAIKEDNFRMMINSSILDIMTIAFIIYFAVIQYREDIQALGLSLKNFLNNVFYGIVGYIATVPLLIAILAGIAFVITITKYVPERQPVVELFLKEKNVTFLVYSSIFASVVGPVIEELFFRAFMYNAVKKYIGIFWAMILTSAIFASLHANVVGFLPIMVLGIVLAYLYEKTGSLISSITVHVMHNMSMVFLVFLVKQVNVGV